MTVILSNCCNANVRVEGRTTHYYVCSKCGQACDASLIAALDSAGVHPAPAMSTPDMKKVGYWRRSEYSKEDLPWPSAVRKLPADTKHKVLLYLKRGKLHAAWMGISRCRLCGCTNGSTCLTDGLFVWPEGYAHYIDAHDVPVDPELLAHIITQP